MRPCRNEANVSSRLSEPFHPARAILDPRSNLVEFLQSYMLKRKARGLMWGEFRLTVNIPGPAWNNAHGRTPLIRYIGGHGSCPGPADSPLMNGR